MEMEISSIQLAEASFTFSLIVLPPILGFIHSLVKKANKMEMIFLYYAFIGVGVQGIVTGIIQFLHPDFVVTYVEWPYSPFLLELGLANLSYGLLGLLSPWMNRGWQNATAVGYSLFLLFTGIGHVIHILRDGPSAGHTGAFLYSDLLIPLAFLILFLFRLQYSK